MHRPAAMIAAAVAAIAALATIAAVVIVGTTSASAAVRPATPRDVVTQLAAHCDSAYLRAAVDNPPADAACTIGTADVELDGFHSNAERDAFVRLETNVADVPAANLRIGRHFVVEALTPGARADLGRFGGVRP